MCALSYARAVHAAGGFPVILPPIVEMIPEQLRRCSGFVLTGGDDPRTEPFGEPTHPKATPVHPMRQTYDTVLVKTLLEQSEIPTLGVCLGMQMMALAAGGRLDQHLPETLTSHERHWNNVRHPVRMVRAVEGMGDGEVTSHHRQAVGDPGRLAVLATSDDGVIEAIELPRARFFLGVQWHPERTGEGMLGLGVFKRLIHAAREREAAV